MEAKDWFGLGVAVMAIAGPFGIALWQRRSTAPQLAEERAIAHEAAGPEFDILVADFVEVRTGWVLTALVEMVRGPALAQADVTIRGDHVRRFRRGAAGAPSNEQPDFENIVWRDVSPGAKIKLFVEVGHAVPDPVSVTVDLACVEWDAPAHRWVRSVTASEYKLRSRQEDGGGPYLLRTMD